MRSCFLFRVTNWWLTMACSNKCNQPCEHVFDEQSILSNLEQHKTETSGCPYLIVKRSDRLDESISVVWRENLNYEDLMKEICDAFSIEENQVEQIFYGDPLTKLHPNKTVSLQSGVVIIADIKDEQNQNVVEQTNVKRNSSYEVTDAVDNVLAECRKYAESNSLWQYLKRNPQLFRHDGVLYRLVLDQLGLAYDRHYMLPSLSKTIMLVYSVDDDQLELCIPNIGHFAINEEFDNAVSYKLQYSPQAIDIIKCFELPEWEASLPSTTVYGVPSCR